MAAIGRSSTTPATRQAAAAERVEKFAAEQRRLKADAASRRAEAAARVDAGFVVSADEPKPAAVPRKKYLS